MSVQQPLPPTPAIYSAMKTPENTDGNPDDPEPADEGDIQIDKPSLILGNTG